MTRPLALIDGNLALPNAWSLGGLPPPFGSSRRPASAAARGEAQRAAITTAERAIQNAVQRKAPLLRGSRVPPGAKFRFFYKLPQKRDLSYRFDEQLAETRGYLGSDRRRPRSSRWDHMLGAAIFVGCSIALAWLLITYTTQSADYVTKAAMVRPELSVHGNPLTAYPAKPALEAAQEVRPVVPVVQTAASSVPKAVQHRAPTIAQSAPKAKAALPRTPARTPPRRSPQPASRASLSAQPEWNARPVPADETAERAALLDWAARQRRANITERATVPVPADTDWNARMTQRRITDNPLAFHTSRAQN